MTNIERLAAKMANKDPALIELFFRFIEIFTEVKREKDEE